MLYFLKSKEGDYFPAKIGRGRSLGKGRSKLISFPHIPTHSSTISSPLLPKSNQNKNKANSFVWMSSLSKLCHHPPGIPRGDLFKSPLSCISSAPGSLTLGPSPETLSIEALASCGFHSSGFTSPHSICSDGNHHGFLPKSKSDTSRPHSSNCCFVNLSTLSPCVQSMDTFVPVVPQVLPIP